MPSRLAFLVACLSVSCLLVSCHNSTRRQPAPPVGLDARNLAVRANPNNVLSALVTFDSANITSARVLVSGGGEVAETPRSTVVDGPQEILVLGLLPETDYAFTLEVSDGAETLALPVITYRTPELPAFLANEAQVRVVGTSSGGYTLTNFIGPNARSYMFAFDDRGRIRWYTFIPAMGAYAEQAANGNYMTFIGATTGFQADYGYFLELTPGGTEVARYQAPLPFYTDNHELLLTPAPGGGWMTHFFTYDIRIVDTTRIGGTPATNLAGHQLVRYKPNGELDFSWDAWGFFALEDWIEEPAIDRTRPDGDFDHPNSLAIDNDGNYVVSWRNTAEITKIHAQTGAVMYRFGGRNNQFRIVNDPLLNANGEGWAFCGQHSVQVLANGNLLVFDNGLRHRPRLSRAVEYRLDLDTRTATMVWQFRHTPDLYTPFTGSVERLPNGNTLVGFAFMGAVVEVDPAGNVLWEAAIVINGASTVNYRLKRITSLYGDR